MTPEPHTLFHIFFLFLRIFYLVCALMAPIPPSASLNLEYPIYTSDFDPNDSTHLFVGGGGGAGRSGVKNKIVRLWSLEN